MPDIGPAAAAAPIIVTDSTCDLPRAFYDQYGISLVPLKIQFGDESYRSGIDMHLEDFAERLGRGDVHPTTSQPTVQEFSELYTSLASQQGLMGKHGSYASQSSLETRQELLAHSSAAESQEPPQTTRENSSLGQRIGGLPPASRARKLLVRSFVARSSTHSAALPCMS